MSYKLSGRLITVLSRNCLIRVIAGCERLKTSRHFANAKSPIFGASSKVKFTALIPKRVHHKYTPLNILESFPKAICRGY